MKCDDNIILLSANDDFSDHSLCSKLHFLASSTANLKQEISELETIKLGKQTNHLLKLEYCDKQLTFKIGLKRHIESVHVFSCNTCLNIVRFVCKDSLKLE